MCLLFWVLVFRQLLSWFLRWMHLWHFFVATWSTFWRITQRGFTDTLNHKPRRLNGVLFSSDWIHDMAKKLGTVHICCFRWFIDRLSVFKHIFTFIWFTLNSWRLGEGKLSRSPGWGCVRYDICTYWKYIIVVMIYDKYIVALYTLMGLQDK